MKTYYIAISYGYWGRGETIAEAKASHHKSGGRKNAKDLLLYRNDNDKNDEKPYVDNYGTICFHGELTKQERV